MRRRFADVLHGLPLGDAIMRTAATLGLSVLLWVAPVMAAYDTNDPDCRAGWEDGYLSGKSDALEGRERNGILASKRGKLLARGRANPSEYASCSA